MKESSQTFGKFVIDKGKGQRVGGDGGGAGVSGRGDVGGRVRPNVNFRIKQRYREEIVDLRVVGGSDTPNLKLLKVS